MLAIGRREFIALISGVAAAWPLAAQAQQPARSRRIGVLMVGAADDPGSPVIIGAFLQGMAELGWTDRRNMVINYRWAARRSGALSKIRVRAGRTLAGCHCGCRRSVGGCIATGDPFDTDRVRECRRSRRKWLGRKPRAAGRQSHGLCHIRIRASARSGWSCSSKSRPVSGESPFFGIRPSRPASASLPQSRR